MRTRPFLILGGELASVAALVSFICSVRLYRYR